LEEVKRLIQYYFPTANVPQPYASHLLSPVLGAPFYLFHRTVPEALSKLIPVFPNVIDRIIETRAGPGPQVLDASESLLDATTGLPKGK